ncbi:MAG: response regulator transcription factor [Acidaminococcales bacterium]|jgi:DNA-binding NarL/FixJ family response regulator|nr:response regulator transcription factor [Acidaminococcales bacterium]
MKILIADGCTFVREGIKSILRAEKDMHVAGEAEDGEIAAKLAKELKPDIVLLDSGLPKMGGFELNRRLRGHCKVIFIAGEKNAPEADLSRIEAAGCLRGNIPAASLAGALREIKGDGADWAKGAKPSPPGAGGAKEIRLTAREMEILQLIGCGMNNRDIAGKLYLSEKTVKNHLTNIFKKLKVHDRTQAVLYALKNKMVSL